MTLLRYNSKYVIQSTVSATTASSTLGADPNASQTFSLSGNQTVLVIYQANNVHGATMIADGMQNAISVDGVTYANSWDSAFDSDYVARNCVFWIGSLAPGSHTITGLFASNSDSDIVTISNRILNIYILDGDEFNYIDNATISTTTSSTLGTDTNANISFTPSGQCKALYLYNISNSPGTSENIRGKKAAISVAGTNYSQAEKSASGQDFVDSIFMCYANSLTAISTTVTGQFASNLNTNTTTISKRQLGVLLFADSTLLDIITSDIQVNTTSLFPVNDTQATITRTTTDTRELLTVCMGTKRNGVDTTVSTGLGYGISVNAVDKQNSRSSSAGGSDAAESSGTCWSETISSGNQTVQGRFGNNSGSDTTYIDSRRLIALWLIPLPPVPATMMGLNRFTLT